jgi:hypothetical protein
MQVTPFQWWNPKIALPLPILAASMVALSLLGTNKVRRAGNTASKGTLKLT